MRKIKQKIMAMAIGISITLATAPATVFAFEEPTSGTFGYEIYEFANLVLTGAIGVCLALGILSYCVYFILRSHIFGAISCATAALILVKIEDIAYSLGAVFY